MTIGRTRASLLAAGLMMVLLPAVSAHAALSKAQMKCSQTLAKAGLGFVKGKLKLLQKCHNANLKDGSCPTPDSTAITKLEDKLGAAIDKSCGALSSFSLKGLGFPGPCADATPATYTVGELKDCMKTSHEAIVDQMIALQYDATLSTPLGGSADDLKCQATVAKQSGALVACILKNVSKCRGDVQKGKPLGVPPDLCATDYDKAAAAISKCKTKLTEGIAGACSAQQITDLKICTPDQIDAAGAASCLIDEHTVRTDGTEISVPPDLVDYEFATRGGLCGDNVVNSLNEECDGTDDSACPGQCGAALVPNGHFACLCKTKSRMVVVEHANADTDNGWQGVSVDGGVVEGGNYLVDLYDCDNTGLCIVGPNCSLPPHSSCAVPMPAVSGTTSDSICSGLGQGVCRKERTANGPHCYQDINKKCNPRLPADPICNGVSDFCVLTFHGPPVAATATGVSVCNISVLSEDVVGTANINDGTAAVKVRQRARTYLGIQQNKPCPLCGGFCGISRDPCTTNGDCGVGDGVCITASVCSDGPRQDLPCRATPPFGGNNNFFGVTSVDCPVPTGQGLVTDIDGLDINVNPRTTGIATLLPSQPCTGVGFTNKTCLGGGNQGAVCTVNSECPGGTCSPQCFCSGQQQPNACSDACVGGANEAMECPNGNADCPGGFCHAGDCRVNPLDTDSNQEGVCTAGPVVGHCSTTVVRGCTSAADCLPAQCSFCTTGETCIVSNRQCFVNSGIIRTGNPRTPNGESGGAYCVPATNGGSINATAGFPGPGALIQHETVLYTP
jgi:hypothetical protein